jgi:hypothetical protein
MTLNDSRALYGLYFNDVGEKSELGAKAVEHGLLSIMRKP